MEDIYDEVVIGLTKEESELFESYADYKKLTLEDMFKTALNEIMEQEVYFYGE